MKRLLPDPEPTDPDQATSGLALGELAPPDRPYLGLNMVATVDGAATVEGRTHSLSDETDRAVFHGLRTQVDAVMVGAATARVERYGRIVKDERRRERRISEGLAPTPVACIVSGRLDLPLDLPLLRDPDSHVVVLTGSDAGLGETPARVDYLLGTARDEHGAVALAPLLTRLRSEHGIRSVLCEGGPTLNRGLLDAGLVDELFLTVAPMLVTGAPEATIVAGAPLAELSGLELVTCHEHDGSLFLRYRLLGG